MNTATQRLTPHLLHRRQIGGQLCETQYRTFYGPLMALCRDYVHNPQTAEDIVQEAFTRSIELDVNTTGPFWPWISMVARNLCIDHIRRSTARTALPLAFDRVDPTASEEMDRLLERLDTERMRPVLMEGFQKLRARQRRILWLRDVEGWDYEAIAELEGSTPCAIRTLTYRARGKLHARVAKTCGQAVAAILGVRRVFAPRSTSGVASHAGTATLATISAAVLITATLAITTFGPVLDEIQGRSPATRAATSNRSPHGPTIPDTLGAQTEATEGGDTQEQTIDQGPVKAEAKSKRRDGGVVPGENYLRIEVRDHEGHLLYRDTTGLDCKYTGDGFLHENPFVTAPC